MFRPALDNRCGRIRSPRHATYVVLHAASTRARKECENVNACAYLYFYVLFCVVLVRFVVVVVATSCRAPSSQQVNIE